MRISDWSSDVCSSDLLVGALLRLGRVRHDPERDVVAVQTAAAGERGQGDMLPVRHCVRYLGKHLTPPVRHAVRWSTPAHYSPHLTRYERAMTGSTVAFIMHLFAHSRSLPRSAERRVGKECVSTCRSGWSTSP